MYKITEIQGIEEENAIQKLNNNLISFAHIYRNQKKVQTDGKKKK